MTKPVKKGAKYELIIDDLAYGGDGVGRIENFAIFVPGGIPGERVKIEITEVKKRYARGKIMEIINKSPDRVNPPCSVFEECGGCQLKHLSYSAQLKLKKKMVEDILSRIGGLKVPVKPVLGMEFPRFYRNKAQYPLAYDSNNRIIAGFYAPGTHRVISHDKCEIQHPLINRVVRETIAVLEELEIPLYDEREHRGNLRHLFVRVGVCTNQAMLVLVTRKRDFPKKEDFIQKITSRVPELISLHQNFNPERTSVVLGKETWKIWGKDNITDYIGDLRFDISPSSFFQVNTLQTRVLYEQVKKYANLTGEEVILDAYCGIGTIALYLANRARLVYGVEVVEEAVIDAEKNAWLNGINNTFFFQGKVEEVIPRLEGKIEKPDVIVVDPPRRGCEPEFLEFCAGIRPQRMIYVSCNPSTLARDLAFLEEKGMKTVEVQPVDMFPHTYHVESVALVESKDSLQM